MVIIETADVVDEDRTEAFHKVAQMQAAGDVILPPRLLPLEERRLYVRQTLREDHRFRIKNRPEGAQAKFDKLAGDFFSFFRGTALLFYRDYAGMDAHLPIVFTVGDIHPENFGVMPNEDDAPFFGVNDFDEAYFAPFSYDVKRGSVGFFIAGRENGLSKKKARKVVKAFVKGYLNGLIEFAKDDREKWHEFRIDNSPKLIRALLESAREERREFLSELIDLEKGRFVSSEEIVPHSRYVSKFQEIVDTYRRENETADDEKDDNFFKVLDVAVKKGSGTASLGLDRYFVLINGRSDVPDDNIVLEMKQTRRSALYGLVPDDSLPSKDEAKQIVEAHNIHLAGGDPFYGHVTIDDQSFLVRERSPYKDDIDIDDLNYKEFKKYARICGKALAQTHARSDEDTGVMAGNAEKRILSSINLKLFCHDVVRFAETATKRLKADYKHFKKDHALGAFAFVQQT